MPPSAIRRLPSAAGLGQSGLDERVGDENLPSVKSASESGVWHVLGGGIFGKERTRGLERFGGFLFPMDVSS
jgi:hypothetical protein